MVELSEKQGKGLPRAAMIAVAEDGVSDGEIDASIAELARLLDTAGAVGAVSVIQRRSAPNARTYLGSGKCAELKTLCENEDIALICADSELDCKVMDRTLLILDIFALHADSGEGKLQVEIAQLKYTIPRLTGQGQALSRQGGGIGTRGPGESKLESDRRHLRRRIAALERKLSELERSRAVQRAERGRSGLYKIAVVGYTNAGKSTLLNTMTAADVLAKDQLFATLDPTTRRLTLPSGRTVLLTDTVGFIRGLPHHLIRAFRATLDEVKYADAILMVADSNDPCVAEQLEVTRSLLADLGAAEKPTLLVYNKCDLLPMVPENGEDTVYVCARSGQGLDALSERLERMADDGTKRVTYLFAPHESAKLARLYDRAVVENVDYTEQGTAVTVLADRKTRGQYARWEK